METALSVLSRNNCMPLGVFYISSNDTVINELFLHLRENFLNLDVYMKALSYEAIEQHVAYDLINLWSK